MDTYKDRKDRKINEKVIIWDAEAQSYVALPICELEEIQPTAENNTTSSNNVACNITETNKSEESQASWKDEYAVKKLIDLWKTNESLFKSSKIRNDVVWRQIAAELQKTNPNWVYTGTQCENKFKDVRKNYVKVKDHNTNTTGGERKTCKFYEEMEEVLGDKPSIKPVAIASTLRKRPSSRAPDSNNYQTCASTSEEDVSEEMQGGAQSRKRNRIERSFEEWAMSMRQDSQQKEKERERRHQERLEKQEKAISTYKELMSKLLDKL